jgi:hypothetical protein
MYKSTKPVRSNRLRRSVIIFTVLLLTASLWPQNLQSQGQQEDFTSYVGLRINDLFRRFGVPQTVHSVRGEEVWQDDVVFVYEHGDFYIHGDRVWQIRIRSAYGLHIGDTKAAVILVLGQRAQDRGRYIVCPVPGSSFPLSLRFNFNNTDRISEIFIYRPDY